MLTLSLIAILAAGPASDAQNAGLQRELGKTLFKQGRVEEAIARFQAAVKLNPGDAVAWYNLAYASRKGKHFDQAAEAYQRYTALSPDDPDGWFGLGESLRETGKRPEAIAAYQAYIAKEKRASEQKWVNQAKSRIAELQSPAAIPTPSATPAPSPPPSTSTTQGTPASTSTTPSPSTSTTPGTPPSTSTSSNPGTPPSTTASTLKKADAAFAAKDYRTALFAYQDAILADPKSVEALVKAGETYARMGHDPEAVQQWNRALQLDPQNAAARAGIAAAAERGQALAAEKPAPPPLQTAPVDETAARAHYTKAVGFVRERKYDDAIAELDKSLAAKPGFAVALVARGSARIGQGRYQDAVADYTAAQKADPSLASPLFGLAEAYRGMGQAEKAADLYRQFAASRAPDADPGLKDYALHNAEALSPE